MPARYTTADLAAAKAQGAADERAEILGLLADPATVVSVTGRTRYADTRDARTILAVLRVLIAERGAS